MLFNSYIFIILFLPICLAGYYLLQKKQHSEIAKVFLIGMSLWFYAYFNISYLGIILTSIAVNYLLYWCIRSMQQKELYKWTYGIMIVGPIITHIEMIP